MRTHVVLNALSLAARPPQMAPGRRLYAVGDIHGRADLLDQILELIEDDLDRGERFQGLPILVFLGDYVDRGLESCACVERLCQLAAAGRYEARFLRGNHEAGMLTFMANPRARPSADWLTFGGMETLYSYGVAAPLAAADPEALATAAAALVEALPPHHAAFLNELELHVQYGDYLFVHAGLRPGRALDRQDEADLLGIRDQFLNARGKFPYVVVHGHTPVDAVFRDARRIAVDTGAYATGRLSAIRLMGEEMAVLSTKP